MEEQGEKNQPVEEKQESPLPQGNEAKPARRRITWKRALIVATVFFFGWHWAFVGLATKAMKNCPSAKSVVEWKMNPVTNRVRIVFDLSGYQGLEKPDPDLAKAQMKKLEDGYAAELNGIARRTAQAAMRHSPLDLTVNFHTDPTLFDVARATEALAAPFLYDARCPAELPRTQPHDIGPKTS